MSSQPTRGTQKLSGTGRLAGAPHAFDYPRDPRHDASKAEPHPSVMRGDHNQLTVKIGGEAGFGIAVSGLMLTRALSRGGLSVMDYTEYPSLIRGGHNAFWLRVADRKVHAPTGALNVLIALNKATLFLHEDELTEDGAIIYDSDEIALGEGDLKRPWLQTFGVPMETLALEAAGQKLMRNTVALGAFLALTGYPLSKLSEVIEDVFGAKGKRSVIEANQAAATAGYDFVHHIHRGAFAYKLHAKRNAAHQIALTGADAIAFGAIAAGCSFYSAYPMTPSSGVLHYLAATQQQTGMVVKHAEDEIAAINQAIGASFAGARAMTGSAGGGFALMVEALGLAAITETPLVIMEAMRPGPATGLPTWTDQGDLRFILHAAQGEFPRVILAPGDVDESFEFTAEAFNLADRFQLPVFVLTDKYLAESHWTTAPFRSAPKVNRGKLVETAELKRLRRRFKRFELTEDGVSPRSIPGQPNGIFMANSDEHDEFGYSTEDAKLRVAMVHKRFAKLTELAKTVPSAKLQGPKTADLTIVGWGSTKGAILEALEHLQSDGVTANYLQLRTIWPFPTAIVEQVLGHARQVLLVENNFTAQLGGLIREQTGIQITEHLLKYDGRPIYPEEVYRRALEFFPSVEPVAKVKPVAAKKPARKPAAKKTTTKKKVVAKPIAKKAAPKPKPKKVTKIKVRKSGG